MTATPKRRKPVPRETPIHRTILHWLQWKLPRAVIHHSPNELDMAGKQAVIAIGKARSLGTRKGWPDIEVILNGVMMFFEVKVPKGAGPDEDQLRVHEELRANGARVAVVRCIEDVEEALGDWGILPAKAR